MGEKQDGASQTLSGKIDRLFKTVHPGSRGEYTYEEVATALKERGGPTVSATYLWQLRKGVRDNPTKKHLEALAGFFGVPPAYFFDDEAAERIDAELEFLAAMRDNPVRGIALRAAGLSPGMLRLIRNIIDEAREFEGLPDDEPGHEAD